MKVRTACMRRGHTLACMLALCLLAFASARTLNAQAMSAYFFSDGTGTATDMAAATMIFGTGTDDAVAGPFNIGFSFVLNGTTYTQFSASSNGYIGLGGTNAASYLSGSFSSTNLGVPIVAALWRDLHTGNDGNVTYRTTGVAGSRVLTVEWKVRDYPGSGQPTTTRLQVRLYESSNRIDIWYGAVVTSGGTVGVQVTTSNFASITPGNPATVSYATSNGSAMPPSNVNKQYGFDLCTIAIMGNVPQGGTAGMANFDTLMKSVSVMRGSSGTYQPLTVVPAGCQPSANMTYTISGVNASDYSIAPPTASIPSGGTSAPVITFSPSVAGRRYATLTVSGPGGFTRTYYLSALGAPRVTYTGNVAQGGTVAMNSGDVLLSNISVIRGTSVTLTPFTLQNISTNGSASAAVINYSLKGTSGGQYSISPGTSLSALEATTPGLTFSATGIGTIVDTLTVTADGEVRVFPLAAFSEAPGLEIRIDGAVLDSNAQLFRNAYSCLGATYVTYQMQVMNIGAGVLSVNSFAFYQTDTTYQQGQPRYPMLRDNANEGSFVPMVDYVVTDVPPVLPISKNNMTFPLLIGRGQTRTLYLSFNAQRTQKRFGRVYVRSNAQNIANLDEHGEQTPGLLWFDVFGRGVGGRLRENGSDVPVKGVTFPSTRLNESSDARFVFYNAGECDLRISLPDLRVASGDVDEFEIVEKPHSNIDATTNEVVLTPGATDTLVARFTPRQQGSRRAGLRVKTNDSMMMIPGIVEAGVYYIDLFGDGKTGLYMQGHTFGKALIGGGGPEALHGTVRLENNRITPLLITNLEMDGPDMVDFAEDAANPWPALPDTLQPGMVLNLKVTFAPGSGTPGTRSGMVRAITSEGDTIIGVLTGEAATRTISVTPLSLNFNSLTLGKVARQTVMVTNTGTMTLILNHPTVTAGTDFSIGAFPRLELAPGQTEMLEVSFEPTSSGTANGSITFESNAGNGVQNVSLSGIAVSRARGVDDADPSSAIAGREGGTFLAPVEEFSVSGVVGVHDASGLALMQSVPNPSRDLVEIGYILPARGEIALALYDAQGRMVRTLDAGVRDAGEHRVRLSVKDLADGQYHYRLSAGGHMLNRTLTVVR